MPAPRCKHLFRLSLAAILGATGWAQAPAPEAWAPWIFPPVDGQVSGNFTPFFLPGAPPVRWQLNVSSDRPRERTVVAAIDGQGLKLRGGAVLDPRGEGTWTLGAAAVDLGDWFVWLASRWVSMATGEKLSGALSARGDGTWRGGVLDGRAELGLRDGRFEDAARHLVIEGLALGVEFTDLRARRTAPAQVLTWQGGHYDTVPFGPGRVEFEIEGDIVRVAGTSLAIFGGTLETGAWVWRSDRPMLTVTAELRGIEMGKLLFLLPPVLAAAQGKIDGHIALYRDDAGLQIGAGRLSLRQGEFAVLRLAPTPGLLSGQLPAAVRKHYAGLGRLETGGIPLRAELLEVVLTPLGDAEGRTAVVRIEGGPADPDLKAPVVLQVNVRGPLDSLVKFGTDSRLGFRGAGGNFR